MLVFIKHIAYIHFRTFTADCLTGNDIIKPLTEILTNSLVDY